MNNKEMVRRVEGLIADALGEQGKTARLIEDLRAIVRRIRSEETTEAIEPEYFGFAEHGDDPARDGDDFA